jgi:hypothetical protein
VSPRALASWAATSHAVDPLRCGTSDGMAYDGPMLRVAALLRALLCLALLLNGTAYAHAATRMAMGDMAAAAAADDVPPCHEGMGMGMGMDMTMTMPVDDMDMSTAGHHDNDPGLPDCCKTGSCDGFCTQHAPALSALAPLGTLPYPTAEAPAYRADAHASVRLSHRHRPPILAA